MDFAQTLNYLIDQRGGQTSYRIGKDTGISNRLIDYWRKGEKMPGAENLKKLANYFGVSTDYLLGKTDFPYPDLSGKTMTFQPITEEEMEDNPWLSAGRTKRETKKPTTVSDSELIDPLDVQLTDLLRRATPEQKKAWIALLESMQPEK